jgi:hypothetical protein
MHYPIHTIFDRKRVSSESPTSEGEEAVRWVLYLLTEEWKVCCDLQEHVKGDLIFCGRSDEIWVYDYELKTKQQVSY